MTPGEDEEEAWAKGLAFWVGSSCTHGTLDWFIFNNLQTWGGGILDLSGSRYEEPSPCKLLEALNALSYTGDIFGEA